MARTWHAFHYRLLSRSSRLHKQKNRYDSRLCHANTPYSTTESINADLQRLKNKVRHEHEEEPHVGRVSEGDAVQEMKDLALRSRPVGGGFKPPQAALAEDRRGER
jgi:hypothetical protein